MDASSDAAVTIGGGVLCFAVAGHGAFEMPVDDESVPPRRMAASAVQPQDRLRLCTSVEGAHGDPTGVAAVIDHACLPTQSIALDSQCKYAVVARGQADVYLRMPSSAEYREWIWDHAAGSLIASEAGCTVTDTDGRRLDFAQGRRLDANRGILCATPDSHRRLLPSVEAAGLARS
jgi:3'(2'), 5'-bisphosphate nucleotidase